LWQYVSWAGETDTDSFYTSDKVKTLYKNHIKALTSHVNAINGIAFKDDPTIFAWGATLRSS
jgi:mannan endo-1,4-beta-mannosidase